MITYTAWVTLCLEPCPDTTALGSVGIAWVSSHTSRGLSRAAWHGRAQCHSVQQCIPAQAESYLLLVACPSSGTIGWAMKAGEGGLCGAVLTRWPLMIDNKKATPQGGSRITGYKIAPFLLQLTATFGYGRKGCTSPVRGGCTCCAQRYPRSPRDRGVRAPSSYGCP